MQDFDDDDDDDFVIVIVDANGGSSFYGLFFQINNIASKMNKTNNKNRSIKHGLD
jgi:hypothetical protein